MRTSIYLIRHAQTHANLQRRYQSWSDSPLTSYGERQAAALAWRLRRIPFGLVLLSPIGRAEATAAPLLEVRPAIKEQHDPRWAEVSHGCWEGLTYDEVLARFPEEVRARFAGVNGRATGGESLAEVAARVGAA